MFKSIEKVLTPVADALAKNKILIAIRDGFLITVPVTIVASIFLLLSNFPIEGWSDIIASFAGKGWEGYFDRITAIGFNAIALLATIGIGYSYAREEKLHNKISAALVAMVSFLIISPQTHTAFVNEGGRAFRGFAFANLGTAGMFLSMLTAILAVKIFGWAVRKKLVIKLPEGVPPMVMDSFASLIPAAITILFFFVINIIFANTQYEYVHNFVYKILQAPLVGLGTHNLFEVIYQFLSTLFWFFGINGPAVTNTIFGPIHKALTVANFEAAQAGLPMTNIFTAGFSDFFCNFGGGGSTLGLVIMMSTIAKSSRMKTLGRLSLPAGIFGINEPIIFGLPIVLNPIMAVPFILAPVLNTVLATIATHVGILPIIGGIQLPWTMPIVFSGFLVTGTVMGSVVQVILLITNMLVYYPFFKMLDNKYLAEEKVNADTKDEIDNLSFDDLSLD